MDTQRPSQLLEQVHEQDRVVKGTVQLSPPDTGAVIALGQRALDQVLFGVAGPLGPRRGER